MERARTVAGWLAQILLGLMFVGAGRGKFGNWDIFVDRFDAFGYATWFLFLIAVLEIVLGLLTLVPRLAAYSAILISSIMLGAAYTHIATGIGSVVQVVVPLVLCTAVVALRWRDRWRASPHRVPPAS